MKDPIQDYIYKIKQLLYRNINDYPILERDETWQVRKSIKTTSALLPVSLVGKKETNINASGLKSFYDKDSGDHRGIDWYKQNVKNKLTLLNRQFF